MASRRRLTKEFKQEAVRFVLEKRVAMSQVARDLDLHVTMLRQWVRAQHADPTHAFPGEGQQKPEQAELTRLRREVATLRMERDILKSGRVLRQGVDVKFGVVVKHRATWPVEILCKALGVSRSGFYAWLVRPESAHAQADARIGADVRASFLLSDRTLGGRCHVRVDERGVAVRRRGHRSVCASRRRLVHAREHDGAARARCADHGGLASWRSPSAGPSLGPRQSIYERIVSTTAPRTRRDVQHESSRQRVGQFRDGALLLCRSKPSDSP